MLASLLSACAQSDFPAIRASASFTPYSYTNAAGTRRYKLYLPRGYDASRPAALLVDLHGCGSNADEESRWSRYNDLADTFGVLVAYPEQTADANGGRCWNWFQPEHQTREGGEPSLIAGITREVMQRFNVDPARVYIAGISAGGAMADVMAVTYPDLYAAAVVYAGCEYKGTTCTAAIAALPAETSGEFAYQEMGLRARVVPVMVIQGDADPLVPYPNAELIVQQFLASADWADDGANNASMPRQRAATRAGEKPGGYSYEIDDYLDVAGCLVAQRWLIHGLGHAWSNAESNGSPRDELFADPAGPDVSTPAIEFLLSHRLPEQGVACTEV